MSEIMRQMFDQINNMVASRGTSFFMLGMKIAYGKKGNRKDVLL